MPIKAVPWGVPPGALRGQAALRFGFADQFEFASGDRRALNKVRLAAGGSAVNQESAAGLRD
jgi:hypothetical protein